MSDARARHGLQPPTMQWSRWTRRRQGHPAGRHHVDPGVRRRRRDCSPRQRTKNDPIRSKQTFVVISQPSAFSRGQKNQDERNQDDDDGDGCYFNIRRGHESIKTLRKCPRSLGGLFLIGGSWCNNGGLKSHQQLNCLCVCVVSEINSCVVGFL